MRASEVYGGQYLRAADILGKRIPATINNAEMAKVGDDHKIVLYFENKQKGMVLNATNAGVLIDALGDETDNWIGTEVIIFTAKTNFQGKIVDGLKLQLSNGSAGNGQGKPARRVPSGPSHDGDDPRTQARDTRNNGVVSGVDLDDSVPF